MKTVAASLHIQMHVECPECENYIDLLDPDDTDKYDHNDEGQLLKQMFHKHIDHREFECEEVTCSDCKTTFNVKELEW
jgi:hypothetical protein